MPIPERMFHVATLNRSTRGGFEDGDPLAASLGCEGEPPQVIAKRQNAVIVGSALLLSRRCAVRMIQCKGSRAPSNATAEVHVRDCYSSPMPRIEPDALTDPEQVYLAATLREALRIEAVLTERGVNYATQVEVLGRTTLLRSLRHGAAFYVTAAQAEYCRHALAQAGFSSGIVHDAEAPSE
jgi:hypothetical protein